MAFRAITRASATIFRCSVFVSIAAYSTMNSATLAANSASFSAMCSATLTAAITSLRSRGCSHISRNLMGRA
ncbi:hypothetical protein GGR56DRAFT_645450 [Xylariaceae sp. FL0804]|nr:hypothetical protein GGR56DRAFT_645450 [Xylariaceae sp. FL0804]